MTNVNYAVISSRLLEKLRAPGISGTDTSLEVLLKFKDEQALQAFIADPTAIAAQIGATPGTLQIKRVIPVLRYVSAEIGARTIEVLSLAAEGVGVMLMDENSVVTALGAVAHAKGTPAASAVGAKSVVFTTNTFGLTGRGIRVAVIDTGIDDTHPDLLGRVTSRKDFSGDAGGDRVGHGTHCAGLIAGTGRVDPARSALAYDVDLIDAKVLGDDGRGRTDAILEGIVWAVSSERAHILSMSLGASGNFDGTDPLSEAVTWATQQGVCVFVAAGNCGPAGSEIACVIRGPRSICSPGVAASVITVGASDTAGQVAPFSSRGPTTSGMIKPDLLINGTDIVSTLATGVHFGRPLSAGGYTHASGTSMATPQVAAIGALLLEAAGKHGVTLDPAAMKSILTRAAKAIPDVVPAWQGAGILTAASALAVFDQDYGDEPAPVQTPLQVRIEFNGELRKGARIEGRLTVTNSSATPIEALRVNVGGEGVRVETSGADAISADGLAPHAYVTGELAVTPSAAGTLTLLIQGSYRRGEGAAEHGVIREVHQEQVQDVAGPLTISRVRSVTAKACELLLARQRPAGMWAGDIMFNAWTNGMYCILYKVLGLKGTPSSALTWLENHRSGLDETGASDGTFGIVDDPSIHMLEASIVSQVALEIWGRPRDQRVWDFIDALSAARLASAISNADPFTQLFISMASPYRPAGVEPYYSINDIMIPPIELLAIPGFVGASVPNLFAAWGLDAITALAATGVMVREPNPTFPHRVLCAKAERQLLRNQRPDGSWYGTILPTFACTFAMHALGYPNEHPVMQAAFAFIHGQLRADGYLVRYELPVWDTALSILALRQAGYPKNDARLLKGADYLLASQAPNGGVPFKRENSIYPDTDDTAFAILALAALDHPDPGGVARYTERGLEWLLYMQGKTGGWAAFSKDQSEKSPARAPVFKDDPPTADVTAHVLSSLKLATGNRWGKRILDARQRGFDWLLSQQLAKGGFYGRWGMTVTYGTVAVLQAVEDLGERPDQRFVIAGVDCLLRMQKPDGGWGEGFRTYYDVNATESVPSTVEQTAWTVLGLLSVPLTEASRAAVDRGVSYLLERFDELQGWGGGTYSVGALWIYKHSLYPLAWPIWALAKYIQIIGRDQ